nr:transposase (putative), gypsy type [Tanacetum cinerariifolium]
MGRDTIQLENAVSTISQEYLLEFTFEYGIPESLHHELPDPADPIVEFPEGKVGVYTKFFEFANFRYMSFSKRPGKHTPQCYTKPLDSLKNWNNRFFWVDDRVFPTVVDWRTSALKEMPSFGSYSVTDPEALLCLVGLSRRYFLRDDVYPTFLYDDDRDMDLFSLISAPNPAKVKTETRPRAAHKVSLLTATANRVIDMEDMTGASSKKAVVTKDPDSEKSASITSMVGSPGGIYQPGWGVTNNCRLDTQAACQDMVDHIIPPGYFLRAQVTGKERIKATFEEFKKYKDDWVIGHGLRLAIMKCTESTELRQVFADVASAGISKGMSEGLKHGVEHEKAKVDLAAIEAYNPEVDTKYVAALHALKDLKYPLVDQLKKLKDAPIDVIMSSLYLKSDSGEDASLLIRELRPGLPNSSSRCTLKNWKASASSSLIFKLATISYPASVPYVKEKGVSPWLDLIIVRWAQRTWRSSFIQFLFPSLRRALIPSPKLRFALFTSPLDCGSFTEFPVYPEVRNPKDHWSFKEKILLEDAIAANISRAEKKKKCRVVCRTHRVGSAYHTRSDGIPVSVPTVSPQGLAILLADAATQTDIPRMRHLQSCSDPSPYRLCII